MPVTVGVNHPSVVPKSGNGVTIAFPDVCITPILGVPVPIPYPSIYKIASEKQQGAKTKVGGTPVKTKGSPGTPLRPQAVGSKLVSPQLMPEVYQIKGKLSELHAKLLSLPADEPAVWQGVLQDYAVAASALYMTQRED